MKSTISQSSHRCNYSWMITENSLLEYSMYHKWLTADVLIQDSLWELRYEHIVKMWILAKSGHKNKQRKWRRDKCGCIPENRMRAFLFRTIRLKECTWSSRYCSSPIWTLRPMDSAIRKPISIEYTKLERKTRHDTFSKEFWMENV
jgi:hypothetical protein